MAIHSVLPHLAQFIRRKTSGLGLTQTTAPRGLGNGNASRCGSGTIAASVVLQQVYAYDGHVVAANAFFFTHLLESRRTNFV